MNKQSISMIKISWLVAENDASSAGSVCRLVVECRDEPLSAQYRDRDGRRGVRQGSLYAWDYR